MKKVIKNRLYDTDKARHLGDAAARCPVNDFNYWQESLYQKRTGEFFIYGWGNGASRYAKREVDGWTRGEQIIPLDVGSARKWAEKYLSADEYEAIFEVAKDDDSKRTIVVQVPASLYAAIKADAAEKGVTLAAWMEAAARMQLKN